MKISYTVVVRFVNLTNTFRFNCLANGLPIYFGIESQFDRVDDILIELLQIDTFAILAHGIFCVLKYRIIGYKAKIIILDACRTQLNLRGSSPDFAPIYAPQGSIIAFLILNISF